MTTKNSKPTKDDKKWQKKIEKNVKKEKVELDHPSGKERFARILRQAVKKKN